MMAVGNKPQPSLKRRHDSPQPRGFPFGNLRGDHRLGACEGRNARLAATHHVRNGAPAGATPLPDGSGAAYFEAARATWTRRFAVTTSKPHRARARPASPPGGGTGEMNCGHPDFRGDQPTDSGSPRLSSIHFQLCPRPIGRRFAVPVSRRRTSVSRERRWLGRREQAEDCRCGSCAFASGGLVEAAHMAGRIRHRGTVDRQQRGSRALGRRRRASMAGDQAAPCAPMPTHATADPQWRRPVASPHLDVDRKE